jgi:predicted nucleic acid-binding protein
LEVLTEKYNSAGPALTDVVLAALALEFGGTVASADRDFARFDEIRWINPLG